jgi:hypothetical protein
MGIQSITRLTSVETSWSSPMVFHGQNLLTPWFLVCASDIPVSRVFTLDNTGPVVYDSPYPITVTEDGVVVFPSIELDEIPPATLRHLLEEFFEKCWSMSEVHCDSKHSLWPRTSTGVPRFTPRRYSSLGPNCVESSKFLWHREIFISFRSQRATDIHDFRDFGYCGVFKLAQVCWVPFQKSAWCATRPCHQSTAGIATTIHSR